MASVSTLINELYDQLDDYFSYPVYLGIREGITEFPCIIIEPISVIEGGEGEACYGKIDAKVFVNIYGYIRAYNKDKQIIGDSRDKGVLDLARDIKLAIDGDRTIGGYAIHCTITETAFGVVEYPIREVLVSLEILFRQEKGER